MYNFVTKHTPILVLICFCSLLESCNAQTADVLFECADRLEHPFGTCHNFNVPKPSQEQQLKIMNNMGIDNIRQDLAWNLDKFPSLEVIDSILATNTKYGVSNYVILGGGQKGVRPWDNRIEYLSFVENVVERFRSDVKYWEFINEINWLRDSTQTYDFMAYNKILPLVYKTIHQINPNSKVLLSGLAGVNDEILTAMCKSRSFDNFDIFNFHAYCVPEELPKYFHLIRKYMDKYEWSKPVWMTEYGYSTNQDKYYSSKSKESKEIVQAKYIARAHLISFAYGIEKLYWFSFRSWEYDPYDKEQHFGLLHYDTTSKPGYYAYKYFTSICPSGSSRPTLHQYGETYMSEWQMPNKKKVVAIWNPKDVQHVNLTINGRYKAYNYMGERIKKIETISDGVTFVVGAKSVKINLE